MLLITCPWCGDRAQTEFTYRAEMQRLNDLRLQLPKRIGMILFIPGTTPEVSMSSGGTIQRVVESGSGYAEIPGHMR